MCCGEGLGAGWGRACRKVVYYLPFSLQGLPLDFAVPLRQCG